MVCFLIGTQNCDFFSKLIEIFNSTKNKKIILIVPEQHSFYAEKKMIEVFKQLKIEIEVLSFSRLTNKIFNSFGQPQKIVAQKADKIATLNLVLFKLKNKLSTYNFLVNKPDFAELLLQTIEQVKNNNPNFLTLKNKLKTLQNNNLKLKTEEFFLIYKTYCLKLSSNFHDPLNDNTIAKQICDKFEIFKTTNIFFSNFSYFSNSQLNFIKSMLKQTNIFFSFFNKPNCEIFQTTTETISKIKNIAQELNLETTTIQIEKKLKKSETMLMVENVLLEHNIENKTIEKNVDYENNLKIFSASSIFSETEWAVAETIKFARANKNTFSDIAILSANFDAHKTPLVCTLEKYNIPFFLDEPISFDSMLLIKCCKNLIAAANKKNHLIDGCLFVLKTNLTQFSTIEVATFENFIRSRNINHKNFFSNFKSMIIQNESSQKTKLYDELNLNIIIKIQKCIKQTIEKIKNSQNCPKQLAINLIESLKILKIGQKIENKIEQNNFKTQWNSLILLLETIFKSTKNNQISQKQFEFLFNATAKNLNAKKIPPTLNCILVGSIERTFPNEPKMSIILGANESNLPKNQLTNNQFFSDSDLNKLKNLKIDFGKTLNEQNNLNALIAHQAICSASQKLLISFLADQTNPCSHLITTLQNFFKTKIINENNCSNFLNRCLTKKMALSTFALIHNENTTESKSLEHYFRKNKITFFEQNLIKNTKKTKTILPKTISPSQIEQFFSCPRSYFFKYILNIQPTTKFELNRQNAGICFHKILEKIVHLPNFLNISKNKLKTKIELQMQTYFESQKQNNFLPKTQLNLFKKKYSQIILKLCENIKIELESSGFKPEKFEYEINDKSEPNNLEIKLQNGQNVKINGKIDRIDTKPCSQNSILFRIVDYKTNDKTLSYSNLIHGLNLQMLIYLMAITQNNHETKKLIPAEIAYVKILGNLTTYKLNSRNPSKEQIEKIKNSGFFQNGLIFSNQNSPNKTKTLDNKTIDKNNLEILFKFIELKIKKMMLCIEHCDFKPIKHRSSSTTDSTQTNCSICPYIDACDPNTIRTINHNSKLSKSEFFSLAAKELENEPFN